MAESTTEAVAVFPNADDFQAAIDELLSSGFDRAELSLLASERAVEEKLGHVYERVADLADDPKSPRAAYVSTESIGDAEGAVIGGLTYVGAVAAVGGGVASGGTLAGVFAAAAMTGTAGALIGSVLAELVGEHHAKYLQKQIQKGGLLLWVRTRDDAHEKRALEVLRRHAGEDVHLHQLPPMSEQELHE